MNMIVQFITAATSKNIPDFLQESGKKFYIPLN